MLLSKIYIQAIHSCIIILYTVENVENNIFVAIPYKLIVQKKYEIAMLKIL